MIVIPFFLEGHRKTTFAAGFWVLCALVICTPPRLIQLVLGCGGIMKSYPDSQQSSIYKPWGRQGTLGNNADVLLRKGSMAPWTSSEIVLNSKQKRSDHLCNWTVETVQHTAFHLYPLFTLWAEIWVHDKQMFYCSLSMLVRLLLK